VFSGCKIFTILNAAKHITAAVPTGKGLLRFSRLFYFFLYFPKKVLADEDKR